MLQPREHVGLETDRLARLADRVGPDNGEAMIAAAMEDLAILLQETKLAFEMSDIAALRLRALSLQSLSGRLGMPLLAQVAGDVISLSDSHDEAARAATVARMLRVGEHSLFALWDAQAPI